MTRRSCPDDDHREATIRRRWADMPSANSPANPTARTCRDLFPGDHPKPTTCTWWGVTETEGDRHSDQGRHYSNWTHADGFRYQVKWEYPDLIDYEAEYEAKYGKGS